MHAAAAVKVLPVVWHVPIDPDRVDVFVGPSPIHEEVIPAWDHVGEIEFGKAKAWLFSTAHNAMIDIIRKEKRMVTDDSPREDIYEQGYTDLNEILHRCLGNLSEAWRSAILLRDYEGYSYREIGEITGQSEAQVKINIYRARMAMRKMIGKLEMVV